MSPWLVVPSCVVLATLLTRVFITLGPRLGLVDIPDERRIHKGIKPRAGGLAIWMTLLVGFGLLEFFGTSLGGRSSLNSQWITGFIAASAVLVLVGLLDDRFGIPARWKLLGQIVAVVIFFFSSGKVTGVVLGYSTHWVVDLSVTIAWTILLINAFNLIDGMDGLCAGLGVISCLCMAALSYSFGFFHDSVIILIMAGALLGFLVYNFHPAKIFLGDTGSMLVGFFIASIASVSVGERAAVVSLLLPLLVAGVPLFDVLFAVWRRTARAKAHSMLTTTSKNQLFEADKDHLHHRLLASGLSQRKAVWILYGAALLLAAVVAGPFILDERALGLSVTLLAVVTLTAFRYVAPVELRVSGDLLHLALKRPGNARMIEGLYFVYDCIVILIAIAVALFVENSALVSFATFSDYWLIGLVILVSCSVSLRLAKCQTRHWSRATLRDVIAVLMWLGVGLALSFTVSTFLSRDLAWSNLRVFVLVGVLSSVFLLLPRLVTAILRELIIDVQHRSLLRSKGIRDRMVIYGAGDLGELFLHHLKVTEPTQLAENRIIGFVDDNPNLKNKSMDGFKVFGGLEYLETLVSKFGISGLIVCIDKIECHKMSLIEETACKLGLKIIRWSPELRLTDYEGVGSGNAELNPGNRELLS